MRRSGAGVPSSGRHVCFGGTVTLIEIYSGAVGFGAVAMDQPWVVDISGGSVERRDLMPDREAVSHLGSPFGRAEPVPSRSKVRGDPTEGRQEPLGMPRRFEAFHRPFTLSGGLMRILGSIEFSTDVKCCDESGGRFMLVAERAMPWSAWRLLSWHARSARCVVGVCGG